MRNVIAIGLVAATASACSAGRGESGGQTVDRTFPVGAFEQIDVAGPYDVAVRTGANPSVAARGPEKMMERTIVEVQGGKLVIRPREKRGFNFGWSNDDAIQVTVTVPRLRSATIAGSGGIRVDRVQGDNFDGQIEGSGEIDLGAVEVQDLTLGISGSGEARARQGRARNVNYTIAGSGGIDARQVTSETAEVSIAGSGNIAAHAAKTASVDIAGSGDVEVTGGAQCKVNKAGSGDVRCS